MISGTVTNDGVPTITVSVLGQDWIAVVDTGFNGDLELPEALHDTLNARHVGRVMSELAGGHVIEEDAYLVEFPFDGLPVKADATFVAKSEILIGTRLLRTYRLDLDFVAGALHLTRVT